MFSLLSSIQIRIAKKTFEKMKFITMFTVFLILAIALVAAAAADVSLSGDEAVVRDGRKNSASGQKLATFLNWNG